MNKYFDFENIQLIPNKCVVYSRKDCDASVKLGKHKFKLPIVPANMSTVINEELAIEFAKRNYFYVMHRFFIDNYDFTKKLKSMNLISSISIGVKEYEYELIDRLAKDNIIPDYITIDIAHGHSNRVCKIIKYVKEKLPASFIIAGNIATIEAAKDLVSWGADALKVGIGPGKVCITKLKTGFGTAGWQLYATKQIHEAVNVPIIVDGGLRYNGDVAKSIRFGATLCMAGSLFSAHDESPGKLVYIDGRQFKEYYGSASMFNKETKVNIEGKKELQPLKGSIWSTMEELEQDIQSSISYAGGKKLEDIKKVDYVILNKNIYDY